MNIQGDGLMEMGGNEPTEIIRGDDNQIEHTTDTGEAENDE